jgi:hypothetical protein
VLKLKLQRIDKTISAYDNLTLNADKNRQLGFLEKEIKSAQQ